MNRNKIVINSKHGGFGLSQAALLVMQSQGVKMESLNGDLYLPQDSLPRHDSRLVAIVESMGAAANGDSADLEIVEVGRAYKIEEHDGRETVKELDADWTVIP